MNEMEIAGVSNQENSSPLLPEASRRQLDLDLSDAQPKTELTIEEVDKAEDREGEEAAAAAAAEREDAFDDSNEEASPDTFRFKVQSKVRDSLRSLNSFVGSYTFRKIKGSWNFIESKYKSTPYLKVEMKVKNGLSYPVKCAALTLFTLTNILCSSKAKIGPKELHGIYSKMGISDEETLNVRRVCALHVVVALDPTNSLKQTLTYREELQRLSKGEDRLVTQDELMEAVFPSDPVEREAELAAIRENKAADLMAVVEEKKKKDELKEQLQTRCRILVENFETALGQIQFMKSKVLTQLKYEEFCDLIRSCKSQIQKHNNMKASQAPPDTVYFLGLVR
jgi:hypothetical protein